MGLYKLNGFRFLDGDLQTGSLFVGKDAGSSDTTGAENTLVGSNAGRSVTNHEGNSFFGAYAGSNSTGGRNSFFGQRAGTQIPAALIIQLLDVMRMSVRVI